MEIAVPDAPVAATPPPAAALPAPGPMASGPTAPATVAPDNAGLHARAMVKVNLAMTQLNQAVALYGGSSSEEGRELMSVLLKLSSWPSRLLASHSA